MKKYCLYTVLALALVSLSAWASNPSDEHPSSITIKVTNNLNFPVYYSTADSVYYPSLQSGMTSVIPSSDIYSDVAIFPGQSWNVTLSSLYLSGSAPVYYAKPHFYVPMNDGSPGCTFSISCNQISVSGKYAYCNSVGVGVDSTTTTPSLDLTCKANPAVAGTSLNVVASTSFEINPVTTTERKK